MKKPKLLVVGSFNMDYIVSTSLFPHEGESVSATAFRKAPGGKGANQAVQAARLGADVTMFGKVGCDEDARTLLSICEEAGIHTQHVIRDGTFTTGSAHIILEEAPGVSTKNRILVVAGANGSITAQETAFLENEISRFDMVILQNEIPMQINEQVAEYAHARGVPVMLNPAPAAPLSDQLLSCLSYLSPNEHELALIAGLPIRRDAQGVCMEDVRAAAAALRAKGVGSVLVTLGSDGAYLLNDEGAFFSPCAQGIRAVDPTAAGDSFIGAFCVAQACGWTWEDALRFANHTAGLTVSQMGAMPSLPKLDAVEAFLRTKTGDVPDTSALI